MRRVVYVALIVIAAVVAAAAGKDLPTSTFLLVQACSMLQGMMIANLVLRP